MMMEESSDSDILYREPPCTSEGDRGRAANGRLLFVLRRRHICIASGSGEKFNYVKVEIPGIGILDNLWRRMICQH